MSIHYPIMKSVGAVALLLSLAFSMFAGEEPLDKRVYNFNADWKFVQHDIEFSEKGNVDDNQWVQVSCPHTWNDVDTFDNFGLGGHQGESDLWMGVAWYRKHFKLSKADAAKKVIIEFEGVRQVADVYINGVHLGTNETGFIPFGFDLTPFLKFGEENVLSVRVDNTVDPHFEGDRPWNHQNWHPPHGGIYRNVRLHVLDPVHVTLPLYSNLKTQGIYAWTERLNMKETLVGVQAEIQNSTSMTQSSEIAFTICDAEGNVVSRDSKTVELPADSKVMVDQQLPLKKPLLWEPDFPHVYSVAVQLKTKDGFQDLSSVPYAPRVYRWNKDTGFWINGKNVKLHGWGHKPTGSWPGLGAALPNWLRDYTLKQMWEAGGNMIRWGHSAGSATEVRLSDQYGLVTLMPGVDGERDCFGKAWDTRKAAFRDTIIYYRNHPSILMWEGGNYNISAEHTAELREVMDQWDPKGKRYFGFRMSTPAMLPYIDLEVGTVGRRRALPMLPVVESEYDRMEAPRRLWDRHSPPYFGFMGENEAKNTYKSNSEIFAVNAVKEWWTLFESLPDHSGGANWIYSDEPHGTRNYTDTARCTGEVDGVRLPKQAYYALQTMWKGEPRAFIIGHWNYPKDTTKNMYAVIAGAESAEMFINGELVGAGERSNHYLFEWKDVLFSEGKIEVIAKDADGNVVATDSRETVGEPYQLKLTPILPPAGWRADGADVVLVDVEVVDEKGRRCPTAHPRVEFELSGQGKWRGGYNSGREGSINHTYLDLECGINRVSVRATREAGFATLIAKSEGLKPAETQFESLPFEVTGGMSESLPQEYEFALNKAPVWDAQAIEKEVKLAAMPRIVQQAETGNARIFSTFSYTGLGHGEAPAPISHSTLAYTDSALHYLDEIPDYLEDSFVIRSALSDTAYWANDYIVATVSEPIELYVAHDSRVELPEWLLKLEQTEDQIVVRNVRLTLYRTKMSKGDKLRISGNADQGKEKKKSFNIVMFAKPMTE